MSISKQFCTVTKRCPSVAGVHSPDADDARAKINAATPRRKTPFGVDPRRRARTRRSTPRRLRRRSLSRRGGIFISTICGLEGDRWDHVSLFHRASGRMSRSWHWQLGVDVDRSAVGCLGIARGPRALRPPPKTSIPRYVFRESLANPCLQTRASRRAVVDRPDKKNPRAEAPFGGEFLHGLAGTDERPSARIQYRARGEYRPLAHLLAVDGRVDAARWKDLRGGH